MTANGYIVVQPAAREGIGSRLLQLGQSVWLGRELGRDVIVDWRGTVFLEDKARNYFTELFEAVPEILGVTMDYSPSPATSEYESAHERARIKLKPEALARIWADRGSAFRYLIADKSALKLGRVPSYDAACYERYLAEFYRHIVPRPEISEELEKWYDTNLRGHFVVGINVSTGNGYFAKGARFEGKVNVRLFEKERRFLRCLERACERATRDLSPAGRDGYKIFFATDSAPMSDLLSRLPRSVTRRTVFQPPGVGRHFSDYDALGYSDRAAAADTVIDMLLLARCDALVRNSSKFNRYALVTTGWFGGNVQHFEDLQPQARASLRRIQALGRRVRARAMKARGLR